MIWNMKYTNVVSEILCKCKSILYVMLMSHICVSLKFCK